ncbi:16S rRNA (guanine(527)-N(7))-methyltransferase RsmG [Roseinatronobacter alkalisoli]|uniref:Ribosomal RNA small subunit methyltransferase G n=1 Tax=Roseinatronobacter alkalisoli TaxID=3028235 RepID=A0ABT5TA70_9RHOB|nr:16S rRNA (guanine(527)-N(7))-methyltransferase RsmG [Roseinatronobacter sp. HJB301]MDD7971869.1 16S rRNA (guanine(527)-N(7))-methyltransferase RsmG [Roseinatronobacter sp. HJB301]
MTETTIAGINVSRETMDRLNAYSALLEKWNRKINLVAPATIPTLWQRHIVDSAQVFALTPRDVGVWADFGSGGGLPGAVCAILAAEHMPECHFTLVESDKRKAAFLMTVARELGLPVRVLAQRVEAVDPLNAGAVSARALAPLPQLLAWISPHLAQGGIALLPKGKTWQEELEAARSEWQFAVTPHISQTDPAARLLEIKDLSRV